MRPGGQLVHRASPRPDDILDLDPPHDEGVRDKRSMTTPGHSLGAHQHAALIVCKLRDDLDVGGELRGLHVIGIASERRVAPGSIWRIRACVSQSPEPRHVRVADVDGLKKLRERILAELRVVQRSWNGAHVKHVSDFVRLKQGQEHIDGPVRVADCANYKWVG